MIKRVLVGRRLLLMGESADPPPEEIELSQALGDDRVPYVAMGECVLRLPPSLIWDLVEERGNYRLLFLDSVADDSVRYRTIEANEKTAGQDVVDVLNALTGGLLTSSEMITLADGRHLAREWGERRRQIEEAGLRGEGRVDWKHMDKQTLSWFAARLGDSENAPIDVIVDKLLDGRTSVGSDEVRQLILLFGSSESMRRELGRDVIDLRAVRSQGERWHERQLIERDNLIQALKKAVEFFSRHVSADGVTIDALASTTGPADYIAIREALVNQLVHQDYKDQSAPAQVEIRPDAAILFNTGFSLIAEEQLVEGGKSQSRNPLVARALRLIGFAELAGSGIRALQHAWRQAQRRPPRFDSDRKANTFTLTLDWRQVPDLFDERWSARIGVKLTPDQATVLNAMAGSSGFTVEEAASATGLRLDEARATLEYLVRQVLAVEHEGLFHIHDHLRELM